MSVLAGLVGREIGGSRSPRIHEREAAALGLPMIYRLIDLDQRPERLVDVLDAAALFGFAGLNITHPFKQDVIPLLASLSDDARRIGAVNTVVRVGRDWVGHNTDGEGFGDGLMRALPGADLSNVVQFGAGGAGAATADALLARGAAALTLVDPEPARAQALADRLGNSFPAARILVSGSSDVVSDASGVVNASPIGMDGHAGIPFPVELLRPQHWVADIVYFPRETELLRAARAIGCPTVDGTRMVVLQAARAFELFTGLEADRERMLAEFEK